MRRSALLFTILPLMSCKPVACYLGFTTNADGACVIDQPAPCAEGQIRAVDGSCANPSGYDVTDGESLDAPAQAKAKGDLLRAGLEKLAERYDVIERLEGAGLMQTIYFRDSSAPVLAAQQTVMKGIDPGAFAAALHVDLFRRQKVIAQIPGPGVNAIKVLPPVITTEEDIAYFLNALEDSLSSFYSVSTGPVASLASGVVKTAANQVRAVLPAGAVPALLRAGGVEEKKTPSTLN
jgi:hypothetical protein